MAKNDNVIRRAHRIKRMVDAYVEPGNQQKCRLQAYRIVIYPQYYISERTFWRYMRIAEKRKIDDNQLQLSFN